MALKLVHENATAKLVGTHPNTLGSYAEVQTQRWTINVRFLDRSPVPKGCFVPVMETLPSFLQDDIRALQEKQFKRKIQGHQGNLKRELTKEELAELRQCVYAPVRCTSITVGRPLDLIMPPEGFGAKRFTLGTIVSIKVHNAPPRPR